MVVSIGNKLVAEVIFETEGSIQKTQKKVLFYYENVKKDTLNLTFTYLHSLFTIVLRKQTFMRNKLLRAANGSWFQF